MMVRQVVLGNGSLLLNFDNELNIRDLYWPYGGFENHGDRNRTNFGVYTDGKLSWFFEDCWRKEISCTEETPVTDIRASNPEQQVDLVINDAVHWAEDFYMKKIAVKNRSVYPREIKLVFYQDLSIKGIEAGDSAVYDPQTGGIYHYKKGCYILANCRTDKGTAKEYSTGVKRYRGKEGTYRDAEDGMLSLNPVADGPVDSALSVSLNLEAGEEGLVYYWLIVCHSLAALRRANDRFMSKHPETWLQEIIRYYRRWIKRQERDYQDLSPEVQRVFKQSLFTIKAQMDRRGAVVASSDADTFLVARDHYMYLWPRDGAMVAHALDLAGYPEETRKFYTFCGALLSDEGYFLQRYNPDGSPGCTWHPWLMHGQPCLPIQEDETALVIWALGQHCRLYQDEDFARSMFESLVRPSVRFMLDYTDAVTGLPKPSWDLWEERWGIFAFTCGAVYGALQAGAQMARALNAMELADECEKRTAELKQAMVRWLYSEQLGRFARGLLISEQDEMMTDLTLDSSLHGLYAFGAFAPGDEKVVKTIHTLKEGLWVKTSVGGMARYPGDCYFRVADNLHEVPGNPWIITTLWLADWYIRRAEGIGDLEQARELIEWVAAKAVGTCSLPEQVHPYTGEPLSVVPLTWSHSTFVQVVISYLAKRARLRQELH
ncbi:MAG: glycoside hydrolase family 15 protein [Syntrophothermus sp.]|uniref:glycoside hydrolase family 15 protein n=1 Tax=Syntrophothermus sp. TaxID=2736299 RepID=UPI00257B6C6C|nr:glycoside hydrolase family 15 protein [Syntrophothermus sp.]NSW82193.1 glycoside hydrolase family 15 protein [Syntrophothermus sp.]